MAEHYRQPPLDARQALSAARKWLGEESPAYPHFGLAFVDGEVSGLASVAIAPRYRSRAVVVPERLVRVQEGSQCWCRPGADRLSC
jgi:hypothetical protein